MFAAPDPGLLLDGAAVAHNLAIVRGRIDDLPLYAVVKDNAYGHGMIPLARVLADLGIERFAVGSVEEACALTCNTGAPPPATCQDLFPPAP